MIDNAAVSLVLPCYNEEKGLEVILRVVPSFVDEVMVVDNGSDDNSIHIAKQYNATVLSEKVKGYGSALLKGLRYARGRIIIISDCDGSYPLENLEDACSRLLDGGFDFLSGCRFPLTDPTAMPFLNVVSNHFISWLIRSTLKVKITDSQSGMMIFRKEILDAIHVESKGMGFSQEFKIRAWLQPRFNCGEFHISYRPRTGKVKFNKIRDGMKNLYDASVLIRKFWSKRRSK